MRLHDGTQALITDAFANASATSFDFCLKLDTCPLEIARYNADCFLKTSQGNLKKTTNPHEIGRAREIPLDS